MAPRELIATVGLPGSGKTTWAMRQLAASASEPWKVVRLNRDSLRLMMHDSRHYGTYTEGQVLAIERAAVELCFDHGAERVIVDDTNLSPEILRGWQRMAADLCATFVVRSFLHVPPSVCIERDEQRQGKAHIGRRIITDLCARHHRAAVDCVRDLEAAGLARVDREVE